MKVIEFNKHKEERKQKEEERDCATTSSKETKYDIYIAGKPLRFHIETSSRRNRIELKYMRKEKKLDLIPDPLKEIAKLSGDPTLQEEIWVPFEGTDYPINRFLTTLFLGGERYVRFLSWWYHRLTTQRIKAAEKEKEWHKKIADKITGELP